jgi:hypothetical protein
MFSLSFCRNTLRHDFKANGEVLKKENFSLRDIHNDSFFVETPLVTNPR